MSKSYDRWRLRPLISKQIEKMLKAAGVSQEQIERDFIVNESIPEGARFEKKL